MMQISSKNKLERLFAHAETHTKTPAGCEEGGGILRNSKMLNEGGEKSVVPSSAVLLTKNRPSICLMNQAKERPDSWNFCR